MLVISCAHAPPDPDGFSPFSSSCSLPLAADPCPAHVQELREGDSCAVLSGQTSSPMNPGGAQPSVCFQKARAREWWD